MTTLNDEELKRLLSSEETDRIERKERLAGDARDLPFDLHPVTSAKLGDSRRALFEHDYLPAAFAPEFSKPTGAATRSASRRCA